MDPDLFHIVENVPRDAVNDEACIALMSGFKGHVWEVITCPYGHRVLSSFITFMPPAASEFILAEVLQRGSAGVAEAVRHKYASRVLMLVMDHFNAEQLRGLVDHLLADLPTLASHPVASRLLQHIFTSGACDEHRLVLTQRLVGAAHGLELNRHSCATLDSALRWPSPWAQAPLAQALLSGPDLAACMAHSRHGHRVVMRLLDLANAAGVELLRQQLSPHARALRGSKHGLLVLSRLSQLAGRRALPAAGGA